MRYLAAAVSLAAVVGCGSGAGTLNTTVTGLPPGTYSGTETCDATQTEVGIIVYDGSDSVVTTITIGSAGLPVISTGEATVGDVEVISGGNLEIRSEVTNVVSSPNGVTVSLQATAELGCGDTCPYAFDGVCDEVQYCALATDCSDCGPIVLTGPGDVTYQVVDENRIRRTRRLTLLEADAGLAGFSMQCQGVLSR